MPRWGKSGKVPLFSFRVHLHANISVPGLLAGVAVQQDCNTVSLQYSGVLKRPDACNLGSPPAPLYPCPQGVCHPESTDSWESGGHGNVL